MLPLYCQKCLTTLSPYALSTLTSILPGLCIREIFLCCIVLNFFQFLMYKNFFHLFSAGFKSGALVSLFFGFALTK